MKKINTILIALAISSSIQAQSYQKIHAKAILVDTHNDILMKATDDVMMGYKTSEFVFDKNLKGKTHSDLARWKEGGLDVQVFSVFCEGTMKNPYHFANRQLDTLDAVIARHPDKIVKVTNTAELKQVVKKHKIAALSGIEGGHMIEDDISKLDTLFYRGARYLTLTWNNSTSWASSAFDETFKKDIGHKGLNAFGKSVVQRMNQLGMIIDISHLGEQSFWDVISMTTKPIMASHSSVYALCPHRRNLKDEQIKAIAKNGGVIQINFNPAFIDSTAAKKEFDFFQKHKPEQDSLVKAGMHEWTIESYFFSKYPGEAMLTRPPLAMVIQHIEYIIRLVGVDYVGIGSDFDGITNTPQELDDVTSYPLITKSLLEKGYSRKEINKILGGNFLRVLKANELK